MPDADVCVAVYPPEEELVHRIINGTPKLLGEPINGFSTSILHSSLIYSILQMKQVINWTSEKRGHKGVNGVIDEDDGK